jgi:uncharacterized protein (TIGR02588 family)
MKGEDMHQNERSSGAPQHTPPLEWIASGIGLLLGLCVFGFIGWQAVDDPTSPPAVIVEVIDVSPVPGGYRVLFQAQNAGGTAAAQIRIDGILSAESRAPETSSVILDYIPGHSVREGGLFFAQDPHSANLTLRALGFTKP